MSYARALGFLDVLITAAAAAPASGGEACVGNEREDELGAGGDANVGECCPTITWSDATYRKILGRDSYLRLSLSRAYAGLDMLLGPPTREGFSSMLEQLAYDTGDTAVSATFVKQVDQARVRMHQFFPLSGFSLSRVVDSKNGCGSYDAWRAKDFAWTPERLQVLSAVAGTAPQASQLKGIHPASAWLGAMYVADPSKAKQGIQTVPEAKAWLELDPQVRDWIFGAYQVISAAPSSGGAASVTPRLDQLVQAIDGQLVPTPWLSALISVFATKARVLRPREPAPVGPLLRVPFTMTVVPAAEGEGPVRPRRPTTGRPTRPPGPSRDPSLPPRTPPASSGISPALVGVGALAVAAGAYLVTRKARRVV